MASTPAAYKPRQQQSQPSNTGGGQAAGGTGVEPRTHTQFGLTLPQTGEEALNALRAALEQVREYCATVERHKEGAATFLQGPLLDGHEKAANEARVIAGEGDDLIAAMTQLIASVNEATTNEATQMQPTYDAADGSAAFLAPVPTVGQLREH